MGLYLIRYSLRQLADSVNRYATAWWRSCYADVTEGAFTLHDYFLGTDMVRVAIDANINNAKRKKKKNFLEKIFGFDIIKVIL